MAAAAVVTALAAGSAACGGSHAARQGGAPSSSSSRTSAIRAVQAAYTATTAARTARIFLRARTAGAGGTSNSLTVSERGVVDFSGHRADLIVRLPGGMGMEIRLTGTTLYQRLPARARAQLPGHTPWIKIRISRLRAGAGAIPGGGTASPANTLKVLRQAATSVTTVGTGKIDGIPVTHYRAIVNSQPVNVWIDRHDRVRRLQSTSLLSGAGPGGPSSSTPAGARQRLQITLTLYDFGVPVTVSSPPAGQTTDLTSLFARRAAAPAGA